MPCTNRVNWRDQAGEWQWRGVMTGRCCCCCWPSGSDDDGCVIVGIGWAWCCFTLFDGIHYSVTLMTERYGRPRHSPGVVLNCQALTTTPIVSTDYPIVLYWLILTNWCCYYCLMALISLFYYQLLISQYCYPDDCCIINYSAYWVLMNDSGMLLFVFWQIVNYWWQLHWLWLLVLAVH